MKQGKPIFSGRRCSTPAGSDVSTGGEVIIVLGKRSSTLKKILHAHLAECGLAINIDTATARARLIQPRPVRASVNENVGGGEKFPHRRHREAVIFPGRVDKTPSIFEAESR